MPSTNSRNLTLTTVGANVTIRVTYNAVFTNLERFLAANGLQFVERIRVLGVDGAVTTLIATAPSFPAAFLPVTAGAGSQNIPRDLSITVPRSQLQEDLGIGDADEIQCRIEIEPIGLPTNVSALTDIEVLLG